MFWANYSNLIIISLKEGGKISDYTKFIFSCCRGDLDKFLEKFLAI